MSTRRQLGGCGLTIESSSRPMYVRNVGPMFGVERLRHLARPGVAFGSRGTGRAAFGTGASVVPRAEVPFRGQRTHRRFVRLLGENRVIMASNVLAPRVSSWKVLLDCLIRHVLTCGSCLVRSVHRLTCFDGGRSGRRLRYSAI